MFDINIYLKLLETFGFGVAQTGLVVFLLWKIATNDGQRLDLVDFILDELKSGFPYYQYETGPNTIDSKIQDGRCTIKNMDDRPVNFNTDKSSLELPDRYRHLISLTISTGKIE